METVSSAVLPDRMRVFWWYGLALVVVLLDQYTKGLASTNLDYAHPVPVFFWFDLTLHHNTGAAFSFLSEAGGWQRWLFTAIALAMSVAIAVWLFFVPRVQWLLALGLGLILGGAIGNLWDRVALGYVVDFISVHWNTAYFPTFNLADAAITVGAGCLILDSFLHREQENA